MKGLLPILRRRLMRNNPSIEPLCPKEEQNLARLRQQREAAAKRIVDRDG